MKVEAEHIGNRTRVYKVNTEMDHLVLIPQDFNLVVTSENTPQVTVWSNQRIEQGTIYYPFQGTVRIDKLNAFSTAKDDDVRHRFGLYDEITYTLDGRKVRNCNWVRFLKVSSSYGPQVNVVCTKISGEVIYEVVKPIAMHKELIVFYLPEKPEELFMGRMKHSFYRRTMDSILEDSPLDLSMTLVADILQITSPIHTEDERKSISGDSYTSSGNSSSGDLNDATIVTPVKQRSPRGERNLLPCEVCGKAFDRPSLLKRHMRTHTGEKPHVCNVCGKGFSTSSSLNTHRRIHTGEKPHECPVCGKRFTASSNLYYHRMTHQKSKPHKCSLCPKSFPTPGDLRSHMYVHSGSWPFKCQICSRGFSKQTNLKNHLFLHTGDKPFQCRICSKKFALACNLRAHLKTHDDEPQEYCVRCGNDFLASSEEIKDGICQKCEQEPAQDEEETEEVVEIHHKKFSKKPSSLSPVI